MTRVILFLLIVSFTAGCGLKLREEAVQKKEAALTEKEQQLLLKEKTLSLKEQDLLRLEQKLDSSLPDSAIVYNASIIGTWNVKMTCIETSCGGSAVGDTKSETWTFSYQNNHVIVKARAGDKLVRVYTGGLTGNEIKLTEDIAHSPSTPATKLMVRITLKSQNSMEGRRVFDRENDCQIIYSIQLIRQ